MTAFGYVLNVPEGRRAALLEAAAEAADSGFGNPGEPVPKFKHSRRSPLIVFASFQAGAITHLADGRRGTSAGTGLARLNFLDLQPLSVPITYAVLVSAIPARYRNHLERRLQNGGLLPPKTLGAMVDVLTRFDPSLAPRIARYSERRAEQIKAIPPRSRANLAVQRETVATALEITGLPKEELLAWNPAEGQQSFLDGLPQAYVREDAMIVADLSTVPGFTAINDGVTKYASRTFQAKRNPSLKLTVVMANKLALEEQTGADLIYFNETYRSFVMVQYKAMERGAAGPEFRWRDGDQLAEEIGRMDAILTELSSVAPDTDPNGFRFMQNPFLLKFCSRMNFDPDDKGLFPGIYLPLNLWKQLAASGRLKGPKDGNLLTYDNVGRRLSRSEFVAMVGKAWIGTTLGQSAILEKVIREVIASGKTVTLAVKRKPPERASPGGGITDYDPLEGMDELEVLPEDD